MENEIQIISHQSNICPRSVDIFDGRYYSISKRFLTIVGQWPYQSVLQRNISVCFIFILCFSVFGPQIRSMILTWGKLDKFVACFTPLIASMVGLAKLMNFTYYSEEIKKLLQTARNDWERLQNTSQLKILQERAEKGRTFIILDCSVCSVGITCWVLTPLVPKILDALSPLNQSRPKLEMVPTDYMIDSDKYFYPIYFHLTSGILIIMAVKMGIDAFYMCIAQHACGMFEILRYDLENLLQEADTNEAVMLNPDYHKDRFYHDIVSCIKRHKDLIEFVNRIQSTCQWVLILIVWLCVIALSFTGYLTVASTTAREEVMRMGLFTSAQIFHLYVLTLPSHWVSECSSFLPMSAYSCRWYGMSLRSRKLLILLIRASIEPCYITAGKIYAMSIENFCVVLRTSFSYLTVLTSLQ